MGRTNSLATRVVNDAGCWHGFGAEVRAVLRSTAVWILRLVSRQFVQSCVLENDPAFCARVVSTHPIIPRTFAVSVEVVLLLPMLLLSLPVLYGPIWKE